jgi:hypothetical protein
MNFSIVSIERKKIGTYPLLEIIYISTNSHNTVCMFQYERILQKCLLSSCRIHILILPIIDLRPTSVDDLLKMIDGISLILLNITTTPTEVINKLNYLLNSILPKSLNLINYTFERIFLYTLTNAMISRRIFSLSVFRCTNAPLIKSSYSNILNGLISNNRNDKIFLLLSLTMNLIGLKLDSIVYRPFHILSISFFLLYFVSFRKI